MSLADGEFELLLAAAQFPDKREFDLAGGPLGPRALALGRIHKLLSPLARYLQTVCAEIPSELQKEAIAAAAQHLHLTSELLAILDLFGERGLSVLPYKGPALAQSLYGQLGLRPSSDLDLLVKRSDIPAAVALLESRGYMLPADARRVSRAVYMRAQKSYRLIRPDGLLVDLHWALAPPYFRFDYPIEPLFDDHDQVVISGRVIPMIRPEPLLLILAVHAARHQWERLLWLVDIAQLLRLHPVIDWQRVTEQARRYGAYRMLLLALRLAADLLDAPLTAAMVDETRRDPAVPRLAREVSDRMANPRPLRFSERLRFDLRTKERLRDRVRYVLALAFTPSVRDLNLIRLPAALYPLYWLFRPVTFLLRRLG